MASPGRHEGLNPATPCSFDPPGFRHRFAKRPINIRQQPKSSITERTSYLRSDRYGAAQIERIFSGSRQTALQDSAAASRNSSDPAPKILPVGAWFARKPSALPLGGSFREPQTRGLTPLLRGSSGPLGNRALPGA